jgi:hypothetical protein
MEGIGYGMVMAWLVWRSQNAPKEEGRTRPRDKETGCRDVASVVL